MFQRKSDVEGLMSLSVVASAAQATWTYINIELWGRGRLFLDRNSLTISSRPWYTYWKIWDIVSWDDEFPTIIQNPHEQKQVPNHQPVTNQSSPERGFHRIPGTSPRLRRRFGVWSGHLRPGQLRVAVAKPPASSSLLFFPLLWSHPILQWYQKLLGIIEIC